MAHAVRGMLAAACALCVALASSAGPAHAGEPGEGVTVKPVIGPLVEELFQTLLVCRGLERLGYTVEPPMTMSYPDAHTAVGKGEATFLAAHWDPLANDLYEAAGGFRTLSRRGIFVAESLQGYLIDARTARRHRIERIDQLRDPRIAKLFDTDGDGKANLVGCDAGWSCAKVVEHHLETYGLEATVNHEQGSYDEAMQRTVRRKGQGKSVLYYGWIPYWASAVLRPGTDVMWLEVPFSALPGERAGVDTTLITGHNFGFQLNNQRIIAHLPWVRAHPAAGRLFEVMTLPIEDISDQNRRMKAEGSDFATVSGHVDAWIEANRETFDRWVVKARAAAR